jgi:hypothetical protein
LFTQTIDVLFRHDFQKANQIVQEAKKVAASRAELSTTILKQIDMHDVSGLSLIVESIARAAEYASDIAEIVLNLNIESNLQEYG